MYICTHTLVRDNWNGRIMSRSSLARSSPSRWEDARAHACVGVCVCVCVVVCQISGVVLVESLGARVCVCECVCVCL